MTDTVAEGKAADTTIPSARPTDTVTDPSRVVLPLQGRVGRQQVDDTSLPGAEVLAAGDRAGDRLNTATAGEHGSKGTSKFCANSGLMGTTRAAPSSQRLGGNTENSSVANSHNKGEDGFGSTERIASSGAAAGDAAATATDAPLQRELVAPAGGAARMTHSSQMLGSNAEADESPIRNSVCGARSRETSTPAAATDTKGELPRNIEEDAQRGIESTVLSWRGRGCCSLAQRNRPWRRHRVAGLGPCRLIAYGSLADAVRLAARLGGRPSAHLAAFGG